MRYLITLSFLALVLGLILANYSVDQAERFYARFLVAAGIVLLVIAVAVNS